MVENEGRTAPFNFDAALEHFEEVDRRLRAGVVRPDTDKAIYAEVGRRYVETLGRIGSNSLVIKPDNEDGEITFSKQYLLDLVESMRFANLYTAFSEPWSIETHQPFWRGNGTEIRPKLKHGLLSDWMADTFLHFQFRPLSQDDLTKVIHAEEYDSAPELKLKRKMTASLSSNGLKGVRKRLLAQGMKVQKLWVRYPTGYMKDVRYICVPVDTYLRLADIDESQRPSDEELRIIAISLRREEHEKQQAIEERRQRALRDMGIKDIKDTTATTSPAPKAPVLDTARFIERPGIEDEEDGLHSDLDRRLLAGVILLGNEIRFQPEVETILQSLANGIPSRQIAAKIKQPESVVDEILASAHAQSLKSYREQLRKSQK